MPFEQTEEFSHETIKFIFHKENSNKYKWLMVCKGHNFHSFEIKSLYSLISPKHI